jgi:hypothetical protein
MAKNRTVDCSGVKCNECGSNDVIGCGKSSRKISENPPKRILVQQYKCKNCLKIFSTSDYGK